MLLVHIKIDKEILFTGLKKINNPKFFYPRTVGPTVQWWWQALLHLELHAAA